MLNDTIAAISTALQDGAISVIRISGPDSLAIAGRLFSRRVVGSTFCGSVVARMKMT